LRILALEKALPFKASENVENTGLRKSITFKSLRTFWEYWILGIGIGVYTIIVHLSTR
jgi:hypothetical protein